MAQYTNKDYKFDGDRLVWANPDLYLRVKAPYNPQIDTGYVPKQNTRAVVKFTFTVFPDWSKKNETLSIISNMGTYNTTKVFSCLVTNNYYEKPSIWWAGKRGGFNSYDIDSFINNHTYRFDISVEETGPQILYDDATNKEIKRVDTNFDFDASSISKPFLFFENRYGSSQYAKGQTIYYVKFYEGDTLVHNFVPVPAGLQIGSFVVPSNGMFDIVEQKFYANKGTGEFEFGKDASRICVETAKSVYNIINKIVLNQSVEITDFVTKKADGDLVTLEYNVKKDMGIDVINRIQVCSADGTVLTDTTVYQPVGDSGETLIRHTFNVTEE